MIGNDDEKTKRWPISIEKERECWSKQLIPLFINTPEICHHHQKGIINLRKNESINNPYLGKCNKYFCNREIYLRKGTLFEKHNKTPCSVLFNSILAYRKKKFR